MCNTCCERLQHTAPQDTERRPRLPADSPANEIVLLQVPEGGKGAPDRPLAGLSHQQAGDRQSSSREISFPAGLDRLVNAIADSLSAKNASWQEKNARDTMFANLLVSPGCPPELKPELLRYFKGLLYDAKGPNN